MSRVDCVVCGAPMELRFLGEEPFVEPCMDCRAEAWWRSHLQGRTAHAYWQRFIVDLYRPANLFEPAYVMPAHLQDVVPPSWFLYADDAVDDSATLAGPTVAMLLDVDPFYDPADSDACRWLPGEGVSFGAQGSPRCQCVQAPTRWSDRVVAAVKQGVTMTRQEIDMRAAIGAPLPESETLMAVLRNTLVSAAYGMMASSPLMPDEEARLAEWLDDADEDTPVSDSPLNAPETTAQRLEAVQTLLVGAASKTPEVAK